MIQYHSLFTPVSSQIRVGGEKSGLVNRQKAEIRKHKSSGWLNLNEDPFRAGSVEGVSTHPQAFFLFQ